MNAATELISICIPAYKRVHFLQRLLNSIMVQTCRDFEVVLTDDSPGTEVNELVKQYQGKLPLIYHKNPVALGTPENWNEGVRRASGKWIKLMHDDDWFSGPESLQRFADAANAHKDSSFFYSAYNNVFEENGHTQTVRASAFRRKQLLANPVTLFSKNIIGPPSVTMYRNYPEFTYDKTTKWVVDIDFYIRYIQQYPPVYIDAPLVNVGINQHQVTQVSFRKPEVEIPENFYLLKKTGTDHLKNFLVYDAWWRLMRNLDVRSVSQVSEAGYTEPVPRQVQKIISFQQKIPRSLLKTGIFSKLFMLASYLFNGGKS
ncbi:MAG TPA: glycosyltransferase family 2 protein [Chitinophagaceae bacterium]|nr:glycosyltransferase family 2 protein [Chitinophagaceae bacterium]